MPNFQAELKRQVSRLESLRQTTFIDIEAPDIATANDAARALARDEDELEKYMVEWSDDDASRQATDDDVDCRPGVDRTFAIKPPVYRAQANAIEVLGLDPEDYQESE